MSSISSITGSAGAWANTGSAQRKERMFAKVDADGSGGIDKSELQGMLDHIAKHTGSAALSADDLFSKFDTDGDGSISSAELDAGAKSLLPKPSSTLEFAQRAGGPPPGPPPGDGGSSGASSTSSSTSTDPLDTNGDGVVSASERAAGDLKALLTQLFTAADTDGDKTLSSSEKDNLSSKIQAALAQAEPPAPTTDAAAGFAKFAQLVLAQYRQTESASSASSGLVALA